MTWAKPSLVACSAKYGSFMRSASGYSSSPKYARRVVSTTLRVSKPNALVSATPSVPRNGCTAPSTRREESAYARESWVPKHTNAPDAGTSFCIASMTRRRKLERVPGWTTRS